ncbi:putative methyltransferase-domain-containing protein [Xylariales sp. PMI_506]|nr:putative methyltransferase-domain-containing protein [Xylariales sp. PMI_506]
MYVSVLDFPQVWQKPSFADLLACLKKLHIEPPIWNPSTSRRIILEDHENSARFRKEAAAYLAGIIKSNLSWMESDDERETIWDEASKRLSERCGRAGMGEITRKWPFESQAYPAFELVVREPPITGDALGLKTWGSSYFLARLLDQIGHRSLSHILGPSEDNVAPSVLELGSGTGLLGMAAAAIWKTEVLLSDLPTIVPNLAFNVEKNHETIAALGGSMKAGALTWGGLPEEDDEIFAKRNQFKIILVADPLYDDNHPQLLSSAIQEHLKQEDEARVVLMVPLRDETTKRLLANLRHLLGQGDTPLVCLEEASLVGQDDWDDGEDSDQVECWWGVFGAQIAS